MKNKTKIAAFALKCGSAGIIAVVLTIISDFILIGRPSSSYSFLKLGTESMNGLAHWRIIIGTFLGIIVIPLQVAGLIPVYLGLKPAGKIKSLIFVIAECHSAAIAAAFHISYAFIAGSWKLYYAVGPKNAAASEMLRSFNLYWQITIIIIAVDIIISSGLYTFLVACRNTLYPKWMAFLNPLSIFLYTYLIILPIPKPAGGYVAPAFLNLSTLIFFLLSTFTVYKKLSLL